MDVHNLATLSLLPVIEHRQIWHDFVAPRSHRPVADGKRGEMEAQSWDRPVLHTILDVGGRRLHVFNVHLRSPLAVAIPGAKEDTFRWRSVGAWAEGFYLAALRRSGQALEVRLAIERIFDTEPAPWIAVCGDFNAVELEVPVRLIEGRVDDTGNEGLAARALRAVERAVPEARRYTVKHAGARSMLDHILVSPALAACGAGAKIANEALEDEITEAAAEGGALGSFHAPVVAAFTIPG